MSTMLEDLAEVVQNIDESRPYADLDAEIFVETYHATIAQNAEDSRRLKALEQAMEQVKFKVPYESLRLGIEYVQERADEIMRGEL